MSDQNNNTTTTAAVNAADYFSVPTPADVDGDKIYVNAMLHAFVVSLYGIDARNTGYGAAQKTKMAQVAIPAGLPKTAEATFIAVMDARGWTAKREKIGIDFGRWVFSCTPKDGNAGPDIDEPQGGACSVGGVC